jgi:CRISPR system Cascade subunit CasE
MLTPGDRLAFLLRANAVVARGGGPAQRGKRRDVVADALAAIPPGEERIARRHAVMEEAGLSWLHRQGEAAGFRLLHPIAVEGDEWRQIARPGQKPITYNVLDFAGRLEVTAPERLVPALAQGFGRAKAFGCGLMLIRRA